MLPADINLGIPARGPQGIQGPQGPVGPQGPKGDPGEVPQDVATKTYVSEQLATKQDKLDSYSDSASVANDKLTINYKVKQEDGTYSNVPVEFQGGGSKYTFTDGLTETDGVVKFNYNNLFGTVASNNTTKIGADYYGIKIEKKVNGGLMLEA